MLEGDKFLIVDVGGTKALLFLVKYTEGKPEKIKRKKFLCADYSCLEKIIGEFLDQEKGVKYAVIGAAGSVQEGRCFLTNHSWMVEEKQLEKAFEFKKVCIVNDVELVGYGLSDLSKEDLLVLQKGEAQTSRIKSILSVGTGLGEGIVVGKTPLATEGGHCDFASTTEEEVKFFKWMQTRSGHVSYERVLSGEGIQNIYEFYTGKRNLTAGEIFKTLEGNKTADFFLKVLAKEAANLALKTLSLGGVFLTGGVLEKNFLLLQRESFIHAFLDKGRFDFLLKKIQIALIKGDSATLFGGLNVLLAAKETSSLKTKRC